MDVCQGRSGAFRPIRTLGKGSFGKAVLVWSIESDKTYVAKCITITSLTPRDRQACEKEVDVLSKLSHPCIVGYVESFVDGSTFYIIQEFADGGDLLQLINFRKGKFMGEEKALFIVLQVCMALQYLHSRKILHRDIKTENIFLCKSGSVKLGDFGLCRVLQNTSDMAKTICGTPNYFAPELCVGHPYTSKADIWALGCVMYELFTLSRLFTGSNIRSIMVKIRDWQGTPNIGTNYSCFAQQMVNQCLIKDSGNRTTAAELVDLPLFQPVIRKYHQRLQLCGVFSDQIKSPRSPNALPDITQKESSTTSTEPRTPPPLSQSPKDAFGDTMCHAFPVRMSPRKLSGSPVTPRGMSPQHSPRSNIHLTAPVADSAPPMTSPISPRAHLVDSTRLLGMEIREMKNERAILVCIEVTRVVKDSPAAKGGLLKGDLITCWAGRYVNSIEELEEKASTSINRGDVVTVEILRQNDAIRRMTFSVIELKIVCPSDRSNGERKRDKVEKVVAATDAIRKMMDDIITPSQCERVLGDLDYYTMDNLCELPDWAVNDLMDLVETVAKQVDTEINKKVDKDIAKLRDGGRVLI